MNVSLVMSEEELLCFLFNNQYGWGSPDQTRKEWIGYTL